MLRRDVLVDFRPKAGVRFSPHFYNTMEEIDRAISTVDEILEHNARAGREVIVIGYLSSQSEGGGSL